MLGKSKSSSDVVSDLLGGVGGAVVAPEALRALAEGFDVVRPGNLIPTVGAGLGDADKILEDELLDPYDAPESRRIVADGFMEAVAELCEGLDAGSATREYVSGVLSGKVEGALVASKEKLNPALEVLRRQFAEERRGGATEAEDIADLVAGIITCSIPGALKECCSDRTELEGRAFRAALLGCVEESVRGVLKDDGVVPSGGLEEDMRELVRMARDLEPGENGSFFAKVAAASEDRCNGKFIESLLEELSSGATDAEALGGAEAVVERLSSIMGQAKVPLREAFGEMVEKNPDFLRDMLRNLAEEDRESANMNAVDLLHNSVVRTVEDACQRQLDGLISQLDSRGELSDEDVVGMLTQAIGLAGFMGREAVADSLAEMLEDPVTRGAIRGDAVAMGVLRKILVMRKLAGKDSRKKGKLEKLERFGRGKLGGGEDGSEEEDSSLRRFVDQSEALTRGPIGSRLKKSKSMVKKSKSMIMTARDIPMNAFMAMKSSASDKDEKWLQNFLSESVVEDVPWECSKALIILKEGFQVRLFYNHI